MAALLDLGLAPRAETKNGDIRKIPVAFVVVQAVAHNEFVGDHETDVIGLQIGDAALDFVEKHSDAQVFGTALLKEQQQVFQSEAGIENVFDDENGSALDADVEVLDQFNFAGGIGALAIAGDGDEIERNFAAELLREIREKKHRAFQDADEVEWIVGKITAYFAGHLLDALFDSSIGNEDVDGFAWAVTGFFLDGAFPFLGQGRLPLSS
jgi:hypothetical protein